MLALTALSTLRIEAGHDLRAELKRRLSAPPRRLSTFMQLTLIGALDVLRDAPEREWRVALGSATGAADDFAALIADFHAGQLPMPLTFINSQIHIAGLYLAQVAGPILSVAVGDTDAGGEEAQLWQTAADAHPDTLWGWVEIPLDGAPGRSEWLRLEREPAAPPLGWIDCEWDAGMSGAVASGADASGADASGAVASAGGSEPPQSLYAWIEDALAGAGMLERRVPAGPAGCWRVRLYPGSARPPVMTDERTPG